MPVVAATDSWKPTECTSTGSIRTSAATATARPRIRVTGRPANADTAATTAMAVARRTDGSNRVSRAKNPRTATVVPNRGASDSRRSRGRATTSTKATFWPDTASRCDSPAARKSSVAAAGWARSSPNTMPANRALRSGPSTIAPSATQRRTALAARLIGSPGDTGPTSSTASRPAMWRTARSGRPPTGSTRPLTTTRSPAMASSSGPGAPSSSRWRPSRRTSAWSRPRSTSGSETSVTTASSTSWASGGSRPLQARCPSPAARRKAPRATTHGFRRTPPTPTMAAPSSGGTDQDAHAPAATASTRTTGAASVTVREGGGGRRYGDPVAARTGPGPGVVHRPGRIRTFGPLVAFAVPGTLVLMAVVILRAWPCDGTACTQPYGGAWLLVLMAFPTALAAGLPWIVSPLNVAATIVTSVGGWFVFGLWAGRRATREDDATWRTYWRELGLMAAGVIGGVLFGLLVMYLFLTI